jgi:phage gp36-like protein
MVVDGIKLKQEVIENGFEEVDRHRAMLIDYTPTLEGNPPMMNHLSERVALKVLETIDEPGLLRQQWEANLKILRKIPEGEIGLMHTNDAMSAKHNFPFDMTTLFDPSETK